MPHLYHVFSFSSGLGGCEIVTTGGSGSTGKIICHHLTPRPEKVLTRDPTPLSMITHSLGAQSLGYRHNSKN